MQAVRQTGVESRAKTIQCDLSFRGQGVHKRRSRWKLFWSPYTDHTWAVYKVQSCQRSENVAFGAFWCAFMPLFREGGPAKWLINKDLQFHFRDFEPGGRRFESVRARSNTLVKSNTWQSLRAEHAPKIEYPENSQVLDGSQLAGRMGEFAGDQEYCSQIFRRSPASPPQCVRNAGLRVATLGECGIDRCSFWFAPSRFEASTRAFWRLRNGRIRDEACGALRPL